MSRVPELSRQLRILAGRWAELAETATKAATAVAESNGSPETLDAFERADKAEADARKELSKLRSQLLAEVLR